MLLPPNLNSVAMALLSPDSAALLVVFVAPMTQSSLTLSSVAMALLSPDPAALLAFPLECLKLVQRKVPMTRSSLTLNSVAKARRRAHWKVQ